LTFSTQWEEGPDFSPDGRKPAFIVSPDGHTIFYLQQDGNEGDLILVENFR
jgi:Tol biopolymer transport system component